MGSDPPPEAQQFLPTLYPENFLSQVLGLFSGGLGTGLTLVLGALAVGSEYGWETFKLVLTQKPGRLSYFGGKLLSLALVIAVFTLISFAVGAVCSYVVATLQDGTIEWPSFVETLKALGAGLAHIGNLRGDGTLSGYPLQGDRPCHRGSGWYTCWYWRGCSWGLLPRPRAIRWRL